MQNYSRFLLNACVYSCMLLAVSSCKDTDDLGQSGGDQTGNQTEQTAYDFDFSTTRDVDLLIEYKGFELHGPVFFSIYDKNPIVGEGTDEEFVDESIKPILQAYTDKNGKFDQTVTLPAYAKDLHIVTGNFMIGLKRIEAKVANGEAKAMLEKQEQEVGASRGAYRLRAEGELSDDLSIFYNFWNKINISTGANTNNKIYNQWVTPLGKWNTASGRVDYLINEKEANPKLLFPDEVTNGLYATVCEALNSGTTCKESYRAATDLTLIKESEVAICALGSMTCWCNTLGYYYYNVDNRPTSVQDIYPIMLFPNTQDGMRYGNIDYNGSKGMKRGDVIQLMYYPNIANGGDLSGATKIFPKGTKIGFLLKSNGWGCIDQDHSFNWKGWKTKKMNIWAASTDGLSFCGDNGYKYPNTDGEARTAKFAYTDKDGNNYALISIEDACDDKDYDDLVFALNPANVFAELPKVEKGMTTTSGVYAFEDRWPAHSDYDMNDVLVDCKHEVYFNNGKIDKETYLLKTYQNYVSDVSGLAIRLATKATPKSIVMKKIAKGKTEAEPVEFAQDDQEKNVYYLTNNVTREINSTYILELTYSDPQSMSKLATIEPFLYRDLADGRRWEVHLQGKKPTSKMDMSFFRTHDDASSTGNWYQSNSFYPFAFYLANASADMFFDTILNPNYENRPINDFYPEFLPWAQSKGEKNADWYLHPVE